MSKATPEQMRSAITEMDSMAQRAFSEIASFAKLALASLETPKGCTDVEALACVLSSIWGKALDAENCINVMAEQVGCLTLQLTTSGKWSEPLHAIKSVRQWRWQTSRVVITLANIGQKIVFCLGLSAPLQFR